MHLQHLAPDQLVQQVAPFALQQVAPFARHGRRRRLTDRQAFSLGVIDMYSVCFAKHILECGVIVLQVLEEPLLGELWVGQGLCVGLDVSLLEVVGVGLITCEEVGSSRDPYPFRRSAQARYGPQGSGRSAGGSAGDKG